MAKDANDMLANVCERYPQRFAGYAVLPLQNPEAAANELERAVENLGLKRTMIFSNMKGEYLDNQKYWVILERAEKLGIPIYLHPSQPSPDMIKPYLTYPILSGSMWGYAAEAGLHAMRLICRGTFDRYPGLKIILGHLGEAIPFWLWRMDNRWLREKDTVYKDDVFTNKLKRKPSQYVKNNFYVTTSGMCWPPVLRFVLSVMGADKVLFAADYPPESSVEAAQFIDSMPLSDSDKEKICHLNAEKLLQL
jgi:predicted TIM-barrel fold metal-dependent hydrolase